MNIYINKDNQALGPYTEEQISQMIESSSLAPQNLCSIDGTNWQPVSDFIETEEQKAFINKKNLTPETKLKKDSPKKIPQKTKTGNESIHKTSSKSKIPTNKGASSRVSKNTITTPSKAKSPLISSDMGDKRSYFRKIRIETLYPNSRKFLVVLFVIQLIIGGVMMLGGIISLFNSQIFSGLVSVITSIFLLFFAFVTKESGQVLLDIADSTIERNSR